jgi:alkylation response protein AidB-like acyl-CoA dehydrogenase
MDLLPTDEQSEIVATVRTQLERDFNLNDLAALDGADVVIGADLWGRCAELGWFGLGLAEADGGVGYTLVEEALLFEEVGAHATPGPFLATVVAAHVAALAGDQALVAQILSGERRVALAEPEPATGADPEIGAMVSGTFRVTDFGGAELALALHGRHAAVVELGTPGLTPVPSLDQLVPLATVTLDTASLCSAEDRSISLRATVLVAAELSGIARATAEQSTEYAKVREQFGRPVGSFQALKHRCADMAVRADAAVNLTRLAALAVAAGHDDARFQAESARVMAANAALENAQINVQNHGGIGFTLEHTAHRYVTRAQVRARTAGTPFDHLAALLAAPTPA